MCAPCERVRRGSEAATLVRHSDKTGSTAFPPGCGFGSPDPLSPCLCSFECSQLPSGSILLVLKLVELRLEMELFSIVQRGTFLLRKLHPISTSPSPLNPLCQ